MPRKRLRLKGRRGWTNAQRQQLNCGFDYFGAWGDGVKRPYVADPAEVERQMRLAWAALGDELTAAAIATGIGTRPWAWWHFSSPQPRARDMPEALQLSQMGELKPNEAGALEAAEQERERWLAYCRQQNIQPRGRWFLLPLPVENAKQRARAEREREQSN